MLLEATVLEDEGKTLHKSDGLVVSSS